jgi:hypothetical protein
MEGRLMKHQYELLHTAYYCMLYEIYHVKQKEMPIKIAKPYLDNIVRYARIYNVDPIYIMARGFDYFMFIKRNLKHPPILNLSMFNDEFLTKAVMGGLKYSHKVTNNNYLIADLHHNILLCGLSDLYRLLNKYSYRDILRIYKDYKDSLYKDYYEHEYPNTTIEKLHSKAIDNNANWVNTLLLIEGASRLRPLLFLLDDEFGDIFLTHCNSNDYLIYYYGLLKLSKSDTQEVYDYQRESYLREARKMIKGD